MFLLIVIKIIIISIIIIVYMVYNKTWLRVT
jgi:hypothetical protein